jgi:hypothetical protein
LNQNITASCGHETLLTKNINSKRSFAIGKWLN